MSLFGLLNINKPSGVTSRRVVDQVKRLVKPAKVGHAGTLDPLAGGVLVIGVGQATRLVEYVQRLPKRYHATFLLGCTSNTEDVDGEVTPLAGAPRPTLEALQLAAATLTGRIEQRPPAFSAIKVSGRRAYDLARAGEDVQLAPRTVDVHRLQLARYEHPVLELDVECSSGTYVRSLGRDLAERAGTGAVMSALVRTGIGRFTIERAIAADNPTRENIDEHLLPAVSAVEDLMPICHVSEQDARRLADGLPIACSGQSCGELAAIEPRGTLVAILARGTDGTYRPDKYFPAGA
jgi:tRNA pseudouridine55 synthase